MAENTPSQFSNAVSGSTPKDLSPAAQPKVAPQPRYHLLPLARLAANMDIVCVHVTGEYLFRGMGLPLFLMLSFVLASRRREPKPFMVNLKDRARRLMLPFTFWGCVHAVIILATYFIEDRSGQWLGYWWPMLFFGLWFLPFIFFAEVLANPVLRCLGRVPTSLFVPGAVLLGWLWVYGVIGLQLFPPNTILSYVMHGMTGVFFGSAIGRMLGSPPETRWRWMFGSLLVVAWWYHDRGQFWTWNMQLTGWAEHVLGSDSPRDLMGLLHWHMTRYHLAMLVLLACFQWQGVKSRMLVYLGSLTIGIYILHYGVKRYADLMAWLIVQIPSVDPNWYHSPMLRFWLTWIATAMIVAGFKLIPGFKKVI